MMTDRCRLLCAADLNHMRAVKLDKHTGFADENDMYSYFVSAKSGDNVASAFHRIAADWAGVVLTKPEMEIAAVRSPLPSPGGSERWAELSTFGCVVRRSRWWRALSTTRGTPSCRRGTGQTRGRAAAPCNDGGSLGWRFWSAQLCAMCREVGAAAAASGLGLKSSIFGNNTPHHLDHFDDPVWSFLWPFA